MKRLAVHASVALFVFLFLAGPALAQSADRFPRPEFTTGYQEPSMKGQPGARAVFMEWFDVVVLIAALSAATYYSLKRVSRKAIFILSVGAVLYFGFYREGCVCPIGSIQNVALGLAATGYVLPLTVILFFLL